LSPSCTSEGNYLEPALGGTKASIDWTGHGVKVLTSSRREKREAEREHASTAAAESGVASCSSVTRLLTTSGQIQHAFAVREGRVPARGAVEAQWRRAGGQGVDSGAEESAGDPGENVQEDLRRSPQKSTADVSRARGPEDSRGSPNRHLALDAGFPSFATVSRRPCRPVSPCQLSTKLDL
jgi:hypothetical protein